MEKATHEGMAEERLRTVSESEEEPRTTVEHISSITSSELIYPLTDKSSDEL